MHRSVFSGENALQDFFNPQAHITPLVELPAALNPYFTDGVRVFLKLQTFLPLGNIKSISARGMLQQQEQLKGIHTLVENSSGNTAFSLAVLGRSLGIKKMRAWISNEITKGKLQLLQLFGVEPVVNQEQICPDLKDTKSGIYKAQQEGMQQGRYNPDQYHNPINPKTHYEITGPQLWNQICSLDQQYNFQIFCAGLGTTGTFIGISRYLKEQKSDFIALGVVRKPNNPIPGPRTLHLLEHIGFDRRKDLDVLEEVGSKQAYEMSLQLIRAGLVVGPSSGMALCGLFSYLQQMKSGGHLSNLKGNSDLMSVIVVCPDGPYAYLDEYFKYCDPQLFPAIINQELLLENHTTGFFHGTMGGQLACQEAFELLYRTTPDRLQDLQLNENSVLIDLRNLVEFEHVHLPGAVCLPFDEMEIDAFSSYQGKRIILICAYGKKSAFLAHKLQENGYDAVGIQGGMVARSDQDLPRITAKSCSLS